MPRSFLNLVRVLFSLSCMLSYWNSSAQSWVHTWGGAGTDQGRSVATDAGGNIYVAGSTTSSGAGGQDALILKYDFQGNLLWSKTWGGGADDMATAVGIGPDGYIYVAGDTNSFGAGWSDVFLLKMEASGNLVWSQTWGGQSYESGDDIAFDKTGHIYLAAESYSSGNSAIVLKYDQQGTLLSALSWKGPSTYDSLYSVDVDPNGNVLLAGISWDYSVSPDHRRILVVKYDPNGNLLWSLNWQGPGEDEAWGAKIIRSDPNGNIYVLGRTTSFGAGGWDVLLLKLNPNGTLLWSTTWGGPGTDGNPLGGINFKPNGNIEVATSSNSFLGGRYGAVLLEFAPIGVLISSNIFAGNGDVTGQALTLDQNGNPIVTGSSSNASGQWQPVTGTITRPTGLLFSPSFTTSSPTETTTSPTAPLGSPTGPTVDSGGGGTDEWLAANPVIPQTGLISVTTNLHIAPFSISGPVSFSGAGGGEFVAPPGAYTITFGWVPNYATPRPQTLSLGPDGSVTFSGNYTLAQELGFAQVTNNAASNQFPAWSPDGMIYFVSNMGKPANSFDIWRIRGDGSGLSQITQSPSTCCDAGINRVVPVGSTGDFIVRDTNIFHEWLYLHSSTAQSLPVVRSVYDGSSPSYDEFLFVPGGLSASWLAISSDASDTAWDTLSTSLGTCPRPTQLRSSPTNALVGQDTTTAGALLATGSLSCSVNTGEAIIGVSFSPDGSQFVIARTPDPNYYGYDLEIYSSQGTFIRKLTNNGEGPNPVINWNPSWSKDNRIAFSSNSTGRFEIWTINVDGSNLTQVTNSGGITPTWSPDGSKIVFSSDRSGTDQLYLVSPAGAPVIVQPPNPPVNGSGQSQIGQAQSSTSQQGQIAEPVSTGSGNYFYSHTDFSAAGRGLPLQFQRFYNSLDSFPGPLGANWNHGYDILLSQTAAGVATIRWGDGHSETYVLTNGAYTAQAGVFSTLVANSDGTYSLTLKTHTRFIFGSNGKLISVRDKNGNTVQLGYDGGGNLVTVTAPGGRALTLAYDANGRITGVTDPMGRTETFAYDASNNLITATDPIGGMTNYAYDTAHRVTSIILPNGNTLLKNSYDAQGRVVSQTNGRNFTWRFAYDTPLQGETSITDALGNTTIHAYDNVQRIVGITDATGHTTGFGYDANNDRTSVTNQNGQTTNFAFDASGNLIVITDPLSHVTAFTYDANNNLLSATNPKGRTTTFSYDSHSNLTSIQDALGNKVSLAHDSNGELVSKTDARGNTTNLQYSAAGDLTGMTDPLNHTTTMAYDGDGRLISVTDPNLHTAASTYDVLGRLTQVRDALGDKTTLSYDSIGSLLSVTDANGHKTGYLYDAANNLQSVTDALAHVTNYSYDANNNRIKLTDAKGNSTSYKFDALNRLVRVVDPLGFSTAYNYDAIGNVISTTDAKGDTNRFAYDVLNRLLSIAYADHKNVTYAYDSDGNRTSMIDSTGTTSYTYDTLDRLTFVGFPGNKTIGYTYDATGRRSTLTYPDGKSASFRYYADGRLATVSDWLAHATQYSYDPAGNLAKVQYPNSAHIDYTYDAANRLTSVANATAGIPALVFNYTLDSVGNRIKVTEAGIPTTYGYDALNQLTSAGTLPLKTTWTYDAVGNRLSEISPLRTTKYSYDSSDRLVTAGTRAFTYDADGNESSVTDSLTRIRHTYSFSAANRLIAVDEGHTASFVYDGDGNRVSQSAGGATQNYVNDLAAELPVVLQDVFSNGQANSYVYGLDLIEALRPMSNDFYHYDGLGSTVLLSDIRGHAEAANLYDAWGNSLLVGMPANPFRFAGQALDPDTGLYYMRARYYSAADGRFLTRDPLSLRSASPTAFPAYLYCGNNPALFIDPSGLTTLDSGTASNSIFAPYFFEGLKQVGEDLVDPLIQKVGVALSLAGASISPATVGRIAAYSVFVGPASSIVESVQDAISHPERSILEDFQRGSIDLAVTTTLTLGATIPSPAAPVFEIYSVAYGVHREQVENAVLDRFGGWLSNLFAVRPAY